MGSGSKDVAPEDPGFESSSWLFLFIHQRGVRTSKRLCQNSQTSSDTHELSSAAASPCSATLQSPSTDATDATDAPQSPSGAAQPRRIEFSDGDQQSTSKVCTTPLPKKRRPWSKSKAPAADSAADEVISLFTVT